MKQRFHIGDTFRLREGWTEQYPEKYHGRDFIVAGIFDHYVPAAQMGHDPTGHPGFDTSSDSCLYEAEGLPFALYDWEMERSKHDHAHPS